MCTLDNLKIGALALFIARVVRNLSNKHDQLRITLTRPSLALPIAPSTADRTVHGCCRL
jgi:hypothetical protein